MAVRETLANRDRGILERKFVNQVLNHEGNELVRAHKREIQSRLKQHSGKTLSSVQKLVQNNGEAGGTLAIQHQKRQRFLDMKTRTLKSGITKRKKAYPVHNKIIFGHLNNVIRQLKYGFTEAIQEKMKRNQTIELDV